MRVLVVGASPDSPDAELLRRVASTCDAVVAVDRGFDVLCAAGLDCDVFCGDADSISPYGGAQITTALQSDSAGFDVVLYDPHKDATDLSLALSEVARRWGSDCTVVACGLSGGKPDHFLAALGRLLDWPGAVELFENGFEGRLLKAGETWDLSCFHGRRFSFVPLSAYAVVSERNMRWELDSCRLPLLSDLGIANELDLENGLIECHEGRIGAWVYV